MNKIKPKIFISHSWEDNEISRKLAEYLKRDGAEVWIDYAKIEGGESLPKVISNAIDWCDTLVLVWSKSAMESYWVEEEWTCAHSLRKRIIPCIVNKSRLPSILLSKLHIDLKNLEKGYPYLARALRLDVIDQMSSSKKKAINQKPKINKSEKSKNISRSKPHKLLLGDIHVLLADKNTSYLEIARKMLQFQDEAYQVDITTSGEDCIAKLKENYFDILLLDEAIDNKNGMEILSKIINSKIDVPIVILVDEGDEEIAHQALAKGAIDYIVKVRGYLTALPFTINKMLEEIKKKD